MKSMKLSLLVLFTGLGLFLSSCVAENPLGTEDEDNDGLAQEYTGPELIVSSPLSALSTFEVSSNEAVIDVSVSGTASDDNWGDGGVELRINSGSYVKLGTTNFDTNLQLGLGSTTLTLRAVDADINVTNTSFTVNVIDTNEDASGSATEPAVYISGIGVFYGSEPFYADGEKQWIEVTIANASEATNWTLKHARDGFVNTIIHPDDYETYSLANDDIVRTHPSDWTGSDDTVKSDNNADRWDVKRSSTYGWDSRSGFVFIEDGDGNVINAVNYVNEDNSLTLSGDGLSALNEAVSLGLWPSANEVDTTGVSNTELNYLSLVNAHQFATNAQGWTVGEASSLDKALADSNALQIVLDGSDTASSITTNVQLTNLGVVYGSSINWLSSDEAVIENDGTVHRQSADSNILLTAFISNDTVGLTKTFELTVLALADTDAAKLEQDVDSLVASPFTYSAGETNTNVTKPITLYTNTINDGTTINWVSSDENVLTISGDTVTVTRQVTESNVNLTVYMTNASADTNITFDFTVVAAPAFASQLYIWETDADTDGTDAEEFIELWNNTGSSLDFDNGDKYFIVLVNGSDDLSYGALELTNSVADNEVYVIGTDGSGSLSVTPDISISENMQNGADGIALVKSSDMAATKDDLDDDTDLTTTSTFDVNGRTYEKVDALAYDTSDPDDSGLMSTLGVSTQFDEDENGDKDGHSLQRIELDLFEAGTPTPGAK